LSGFGSLSGLVSPRGGRSFSRSGLGRYPALRSGARVNLKEALLRNPVNLETHVYMAALDVTAGDKVAAAWEADEIRMLQPGFSSRGWLETEPMTDVTQKTKLVQALGALGF
jgi:hypothetical protein